MKLWLDVGETHALIVNYDYFLDTAVPTELVIEIAFGRANAQAEYSQHSTWVRSLKDRLISDPRRQHLYSLRWGHVRDVLAVSKGGCRMLDVHG